MDYNKSYLIMHIGLWTGIFIALIFALTEIKWIAYIGAMITLGSLVQAAIFYKCPDCKKALNIRGKKPKYCPECGTKLDN
ncbi:MAG: hypothetical protein M0P77_07850 [Firmicutes bacterium]|nr:hypothetical protein [Bacillota bacterium]